MSNKAVALTAVLSVVFDLIACIGDSNLTLYRVFMGLCCATFIIFVFGLFRVGFSKSEEERTSAKEKTTAYKKAA